MPRVNRDLQRRMAARRERERRRPGGTERRYRFATPESPVESDETLLEQDGQEEAAESVAETAPAPSRATRGATRTKAEPAPVRARVDTPFSAYKDEYGYVYGDLRRVGAVVGLLLVALVVLYFVLPLLVH